LTILKYVCSFAAQMLFRGNHRIDYNCSKRAHFKTQFIAIVFLLFVFVQFTASAKDYSVHENLGNLGQHEGKTWYQPVHNPSQTGTDIPDIEFLQETEVEEKPFLDRDYDFQASLFLTNSLSTPGNLQLQFLRSLQNRPTLSLFILHHSWKSFIV
jgi:hypothetical protein